MYNIELTGDIIIEQVKNFKYLGTVMWRDCKRRIQAGNLSLIHILVKKYKINWDKRPILIEVETN